VSRARPVLAAVPADEEARWRSALAARIRPEFRVDRYLPPREHLVLYGPHCSVAGCDRPGNERLVGPARLCERHARIWARVRGMSIEAWLAEAPEIRRRSDATGMPHYDLTSESPVRRDELRFLLQSLHDGRFTLTFTTKRWNALRAVYRDRESLLGWDLAQHPAPAVVATGSAKRFQLFLLGVRRELLGREPSWRDEVWPREFYAPFDRGLRSKLPAAMDFTCVRAPWLRQLAQRVCWTRLSVEAVAPNVAWQMVRHVAQFERWAEDRVAGPESLTRELLLSRACAPAISAPRRRRPNSSRCGRSSTAPGSLGRRSLRRRPIWRARSSRNARPAFGPGSLMLARSPRSTIPATSPA